MLKEAQAELLTAAGFLKPEVEGEATVSAADPAGKQTLSSLNPPSLLYCQSVSAARSNVRKKSRVGEEWDSEEHEDVAFQSNAQVPPGTVEWKVSISTEGKLTQRKPVSAQGHLVTH